MFGSSLSKGPAPEPIRWPLTLIALSYDIYWLVFGIYILHPHLPPSDILLHEFVRFYTEQWITDEEFIPSNPADLMVLRTKFEDSVKRHLLAEVIDHDHFVDGEQLFSCCCWHRFLMASFSLVALTLPWLLLSVR